MEGWPLGLISRGVVVIGGEKFFYLLFCETGDSSLLLLGIHSPESLEMGFIGFGFIDGVFAEEHGALMRNFDGGSHHLRERYGVNNFF